MKTTFIIKQYSFSNITEAALDTIMSSKSPAVHLKFIQGTKNPDMLSRNNQVSLSVGGFYGSRNKRKWLGIERTIDNAVKRQREEKIPTTFKSRLLGPSTRWETFYRQQDAFSYARSTAKDLHVFAFESETFVGDSGQRMYLVASYPVFWHYYSQLSEDKRHHYEVIPEGAVCKLYFDLEYDVSLNPHRNGDKMVEIFIQYVCLCLRREFGVQVSRDNVLDLQASTEKKFSRHLIFLIKNAAFRNNIHTGKFVCHILSQLLERIKDCNVRQANNNKNQEKSENFNGSLEDANSKVDGESVDLDTIHSFDPGIVSQDSRTGNVHTQLKICKTNETEAAKERQTVCESNIKKVHNNNSNNLLSLDQSENTVGAISMVCDRTTSSNPEISKTEKDVIVGKRMIDSCQDKSKQSKLLKCDFKEVLETFSEEDLQSMVVQNKHGDQILFCDTGVYTKNRNFRLYMSSKLSKRNPLTLSDKNQYRTDKGADSEEQTFYDSLVANVQYCEKMKILSYDYDSQESLKMRSTHRSSQDRNHSAIEGYNKSPYPEVDEFVTSLITQDGARGVIRHWTYFQQGELLVYEIARYRFCHNIGREHRSNNIMYIADLKRGIFYQKCHDPDCQIQSFKSQEWPLPAEVLPAHYFDDLSDDMDFDIEDDDFLNTTAEMERQYFLNQSKESAQQDLSLEDGDDEELVSALEEVEST